MLPLVAIFTTEGPSLSYSTLGIQSEPPKRQSAWSRKLWGAQQRKSSGLNVSLLLQTITKTHPRLLKRALSDRGPSQTSAQTNCIFEHLHIKRSITATQWTLCWIIPTTAASKVKNELSVSVVFKFITRKWLTKWWIPSCKLRSWNVAG